MLLISCVALQLGVFFLASTAAHTAARKGRRPPPSTSRVRVRVPSVPAPGWTPCASSRALRSPRPARQVSGCG
ncbi:hypothetical protein ACFQ0Q_38160 [Streptomyces aureus]